MLTFILLKQHQGASVLNRHTSFQIYLHRGMFGCTSSCESVTSSRQKQTTTPVLVGFLEDSWCATLMSCLLYARSSNAERQQEKQNRNLPQSQLNYFTEFLSCRVSTLHCQSWIYTLTFSDDTHHSTWEHFRKSNTQYYFSLFADRIFHLGFFSNTLSVYF